MTVTDDKEIFYAVASRSPICASVLADPTGEKIHILFLGGEGHSDAEILALADHGLTKHVGIVAMNRDGQFESVAKPGFAASVVRAGEAFLYTLRQERDRQSAEVAELKRIAGLMDPRAQA